MAPWACWQQALGPYRESARKADFAKSAFVLLPSDVFALLHGSLAFVEIFPSRWMLPDTWGHWASATLLQPAIIAWNYASAIIFLTFIGGRTEGWKGISVVFCVLKILKVHLHWYQVFSSMITWNFKRSKFQKSIKNDSLLIKKSSHTSFFWPFKILVFWGRKMPK